LKSLPPGSQIAVESVGNWYWLIDEDEISDLFGVRGRNLIAERLVELPPETKNSIKEQLEFLDQLQQQISTAEERIRQIIKITPEMQLLMSIPGVGPILVVEEINSSFLDLIYALIVIWSQVFFAY
jgi:hypothetical protein